MDTVPKKHLALLMERSTGLCERCGQWAPVMDPHHRMPKGLGGSRRPDRHNLSNLVLLDRGCHDWVHANPLSSQEEGLLVPRSSGRSPLETPILTWMRSWWLLDDQGQMARHEAGETQ